MENREQKYWELFTDKENRERMITNLPKFESDYELLHEKFYNI